MENHPIPQDITGFQFKLIGDMTIKQFAFLAGGTVFAWIIFSLPVTYFLKLPLSSVIVFFGIAFAFLSIEGRPMDTMIFNFIKATFSPTKYVYQPPSFDIAFQTGAAKQDEQVNITPVPFKILTQPQNELDKQSLRSENLKREFDFFHMLSQMLHPAASSPNLSQAQDSNLSHPYIVSGNVKGEERKEHHERPEVEDKKEEEEAQKLQVQTQALQQELKVAVEHEKESQGSQNYEEAHKKVLEVEKLLNETLLSKQSLEKEIQNLKRQLEMQQKQVFTPSSAEAPKTLNVRTIANKAQGKTAGLPIAPEFPNVISGIVKDPRGNPLPNILVEVKDMDGNPVRAFKTNPLGQFQASTALTNGIYTIEFEDPKAMNKFDIIKFEAKGDIVLPVEVISIDTREELRKSLFN